MARGGGIRWVGTGVVVATSSGCFAGAGPTLGYSLHDERPTLGWEVSAETFAVGQSYELGADSGEAVEPEERRVRVVERTYLVWEPRYGVVLDDGLNSTGRSIDNSVGSSLAEGAVVVSNAGRADWTWRSLPAAWTSRSPSRSASVPTSASRGTNSRSGAASA